MKRIKSKDEMFGAIYETERTYEDDLIARWIAGYGFYTHLFEDLYRARLRDRYFERIDKAETEEELKTIGREIHDVCSEFNTSMFIEGVVCGIQLTDAESRRDWSRVTSVVSENIGWLYDRYEKEKRDREKQEAARKAMQSK